MKHRFLLILLSIALLGTCAFAGCQPDNSTVTTDDGVTYTKCTYEHDGESISGYAVSSYKYKISTSEDYIPTVREVTIPATIHDLPVLKISPDAFARGEIDTITIPEGVYYIGAGAFMASAIKTVSLPQSIEYIGDNAFNNCDGLFSINISDTSITSISNGLFNLCTALLNMTIPEGVTTIGECAFYGCSSLAYINLPSTITLLGGDSISSIPTTGNFKIYYASSETDFASITVGERPRYDDYGNIAKWWGINDTNPYTIVYNSQYTPAN